MHDIARNFFHEHYTKPSVRLKAPAVREVRVPYVSFEFLQTSHTL